MLCAWWNYKRVIYYEMLPPNQAIILEKCSFQMVVLKENFEEKPSELTKRRSVIFQHENAWSGIAINFRQRLIEYGWDILWPPSFPYSQALRFLPFQVPWKFLVHFFVDRLNAMITSLRINLFLMEFSKCPNGGKNHRTKWCLCD